MSQLPASQDHGVVIETPLRREAAAAQPETVQRPVKPLPAWERHLPKLYLVVLIVAVIGLAIYPRSASAYNLTLALTVLMTISLASSWNIISGFTGYTSFGHAGFFGIGAYTGALLIFHDTVPWQAAMVIAGLFTAGIALVIGYPTLRLRGPYFAITMLGLAELARIVVTAWDSVTRGGIGVYLPIVRDSKPNYYAMLILAVATVVVSYFIGTSRFGLRLLSIRDDEIAAQAMGIDTTRNKLTAFVISSFFPGVAGAIYARHVGFIDPPTVFLVIWSIRAIATAIVGGQGTILGPIIGAVVLTLVSEQVWASDPNLYQVIFGGIIVLVVIFIPGGLIALLQGWGILPEPQAMSEMFEDPILVASDISVRFGGVQALNRATLTVRPGTITGVIGPNGSGKSTLFNVCTGLARPDSGQVVFNGRTITGLSSHQINRIGIGRTFQLVRLFDRMTSIENLVVVSRDDAEVARRRGEELLALVNLSHLRDEYAGNLSYGQRKLVEFVRLMMTDPALVMLDEPFAGVNPTMEKRLLEQMEGWREDGRTIVVTDHEMKIMMDICEEIFVLDYGEVIARGTPAEVRADERVMEAYFGR